MMPSKTSKMQAQLILKFAMTGMKKPKKKRENSRRKKSRKLKKQRRKTTAMTI